MILYKKPSSSTYNNIISYLNACNTNVNELALSFVNINILVSGNFALYILQNKT